MSFSVPTTQPITTIGGIALAAAEAEEAHETQLFANSEMPEPKGEMRSAQRSYTFTQQQTTHTAPQFRSYVPIPGAKQSAHQPAQSPMRLAQNTYQRGAMGSPTPLPQSSGRAATPYSAPSRPNPGTTTPQAPTARAPSGQTQAPANPVAAPKGALPQPKAEQRGEMPRTANQARAKERGEAREKGFSEVQNRSWKKEDTQAWWQERYHQKERDGQKQGQGRDQEQQQNSPDKKKKKGISGISAAARTQDSSQEQKREPKAAIQKPILQKPRTGVFALYYILTKIGITSDGTSNFSYKKEIESVDSDTTTAHKKRLDELKTAIDKEKAAAKWGIATKVFSWIGSLMGIVAGVAMIATGVGAVAGAMMIAGGLIQITNELLEITGGWKKIAELLPGDDPEKKRAVMNWIQLGIAVLCLILSGAGIIWGGVASFGEATQTAMSLTVINGIAAMGHGATTIGEGVTTFVFKDKMGEVRRYDKILAELLHKRRDLMEKVEWGVDRLEQLFEDLAKALEFEVELFRADQMVNR